MDGRLAAPVIRTVARIQCPKRSAGRTTTKHRPRMKLVSKITRFTLLAQSLSPPHATHENTKCVPAGLDIPNPSIVAIERGPGLLIELGSSGAFRGWRRLLQAYHCRYLQGINVLQSQ
jgi:hypothetical protein